MEYLVNPIKNTNEAMEFAIIGSVSGTTTGGVMDMSPDTVVASIPTKIEETSGGGTLLTGSGGMSAPITGGGTPSTGGTGTIDREKFSERFAGGGITVVAKQKPLDLENYKSATQKAESFLAENKKYIIWLLIASVAFLVYRFGIKNQ